jgi:FixJ family two-component response regulator
MSEPLPAHAATVCLLDDDASILKATGRLLCAAGWEVETFTEPRSFLDYVPTHQPKVVVLDILMPVMNGLEVQTELRIISPSTRVIVLTSNDDAMVRTQAMEAGASAFFLKPVNSQEFLAGIQRAVETD